MIASLPWYDFAETSALHDEFWSLFRKIYSDLDEVKLPISLDRLTSHTDALLNGNLFLTQTCGYDIAFDLPGPLSMVATPVFNTDGAGDGNYSSYLVKSKRFQSFSLKEAISKGQFVANDCRSFSGYQCINEMAALPTIWSGSHIRSIEMISEGLAEWAAIDVVTWGLMEKYCPERLKHVEIFGKSRLVAAPPIVTSIFRTQREIQNIQFTLAQICLGEAGKKLLKSLLVSGFRIVSKNKYQKSFIRNKRIDAWSPSEGPKILSDY
jgi:ABC-type phosphate/phosphonate transport system substrate-binding protein